jgi:hypothetical protein
MQRDSDLRTLLANCVPAFVGAQAAQFSFDFSETIVMLSLKSPETLMMEFEGVAKSLPDHL